MHTVLLNNWLMIVDLPHPVGPSTTMLNELSSFPKTEVADLSNCNLFGSSSWYRIFSGATSKSSSLGGLLTNPFS